MTPSVAASLHREPFTGLRPRVAPGTPRAQEPLAVARWWAPWGVTCKMAASKLMQGGIETMFFLFLGGVILAQVAANKAAAESDAQMDSLWGFVGIAFVLLGIWSIMGTFGLVEVAPTVHSARRRFGRS